MSVIGEPVPWDTPTAIEPQRVLILNEDEQRLALAACNVVALDLFTDTGTFGPPGELAERIAEGDTYADEMDELARTTLRKRRLETEIKRCNQIIDRLTEPVLERLAEVGAKSLTHEASGTRLERTNRIDMAYRDPDWSSDEKADARQQTAETLLAIGGDYAAFIAPAFNANTMSAYFREKYNAAVAAELEKPEHERVPVDPDEIVPPEIRGWYRLNVAPKVKVTAT